LFEADAAADEYLLAQVSKLLISMNDDAIILLFWPPLHLPL